MQLTLPWPPSVNHYYRHVGPRVLISRAGRAYRRAIETMLAGGNSEPPRSGRIALAMDAFPPDRRRRDLDNLLKCTQDSLAHTGVYEDDSQIDSLHIVRRRPIRDGRLVVRVEDLPLRRCILCGHPLAENEKEHNHDN